MADRELCFYYPLVLVVTIFYGSKGDRQDQRVSIKNASDLEVKAISSLLQNRKMHNESKVILQDHKDMIQCVVQCNPASSGW